jgi:hypothetical protein
MIIEELEESDNTELEMSLFPKLQLFVPNQGNAGFRICFTKL